MSSKLHVCMLAAENDVIPGAKVGGIGDVVRDIPTALASQDVEITVIIPAYGAFHLLPDAKLVGACSTLFRGKTERVEIYELYADSIPGVRYLVLHNPVFAACGKGHVYCDDDPSQPFATDANKFAFFCVAGLSVISQDLIGQVDVLHLHDWHTGLASALIKYDPAFESLKALRCVFSIHNIALQGIRPLAENTSSLQTWFPHLHYNPDDLSDPRWPHCVNPIATAIRLADSVHTVSPTYAREIIESNDASKGFHGGEGLEGDLQNAAHQGKLVGILNGIDYSSSGGDALSWPQFIQQTSDELLNIMARKPELISIDYLAHQRLMRWQNLTRPKHIITGVGRLTGQKMALLLNPVEDGSIPLETMLESLDERGLFILLGSGDSELENQCRLIATRNTQFLFLNLYSDRLANLLFANGDLFLMPSSFEPCGISQMLSMREGQPCLAHAVGGLRDTINDNEDGFLFAGDSMEAQSAALQSRFEEILLMREQRPDKFREISNNARKQRFEWRSSAERYISELYQ
ncbi:MAG: glycogen synthase [Granulosicoccus sp.]